MVGESLLAQKPVLNYGSGSQPRILVAAIGCRPFDSSEQYSFCATTAGFEEREHSIRAGGDAITQLEGTSRATTQDHWVVFQRKELFQHISLVFFLLISPGWNEVEARSLQGDFLDLVSNVENNWKDSAGLRKPVRPLVVIWHDQRQNGGDTGFDVEASINSCLGTEVEELRQKMEKRREADEKFGQQRDAVKTKVLDALDLEAQRTPLIDRNLAAASALEKSAKRFEETSTAVEKKYWWLNIKCWIYIGVAGVLGTGLLIFIILAATGNL